MWKGSFAAIPAFFIYWWFFQNGPGILWIVVFFTGLPAALIGPYPAFRARICGGVYLSQLAAFPVTRDEVARVIFKITLLRGMASICFSLVPIAVLTMHLPLWPLEGVAAAVGLSLFLVLLTPWVIVSQYSVASSFPDWRWGNVFRRALLVVPVVIAFIEFPIAISLFSAPARFVPIVATVLAFLFLICTFATYYLSRRFYLRGSVDMVRSSPPHWESNFDQMERAHIQNRRVREVVKKHGWLWWLKHRRSEAETA